MADGQGVKPSGSVGLQKEVYPPKKNLLEGYRQWLIAINYEPTSLREGPKRIKEFLEWLASQGIERIEQISSQVVEHFFDYLWNRKNKRTGELLSINYVRVYQRELKRFSRYLRQTDQGHIEVTVEIKAVNAKLKRPVFSQAEISSLYDTCEDDLLGLRDRAMLSIYYGCGLRRNEGISLATKDVSFSRGLVHVRKGKNHKERFVPMVGRVMHDLQIYLECSRMSLANLKSGNALFLGYTGKPLGSSMMSERLKRLKTKAGVKKEGGLHALRHSIATHLLQSGMELEQIARFLGHRSLESTQIYTHRAEEDLSV